MSFLSRVKVVASDLSDELKGKIHIVRIHSDIMEDSAEHGLGDSTGAGLDNERVGKTFNSIDDAIKYLHDYWGTSSDPDDYEFEDKHLRITKMVADHSEEQNGGWMEPTDEEMKAWQKGNLKLYTEDFSIELLLKDHL